MTAAVDAAEEYAATLDALLQGPARAKARLVRELCDGLTDTVDALTAAGLHRDAAVAEALREFGTPEEVAPSCQRELTLAQTRRTARTALLTVPLLALCWPLLLAAGHEPLPHLLAGGLLGVTGAATLVGAGALALTGVLARRLPTPRRLPLAVAWAGTTAAVASALATLTLLVTAALTTQWPLALAAAALAVTSHALLAPSARTCRHCAHAPA